MLFVRVFSTLAIFKVRKLSLDVFGTLVAIMAGPITTTAASALPSGPPTLPMETPADLGVLPTPVPVVPVPAVPASTTPVLPSGGIASGTPLHLY